MSASSAPEREVVGRHDFWLRTLRLWDLGFVAMVVLSAGAIALDSMPTQRKVVAVALLVLLAVAYGVLGHVAAVRGAPRRADAYLAVLTAVSTAQVVLGGIGTVLLFLAYSQVWFFARTRRAGVLWCAALTVGVTAASVWREGADTGVAAQIAGQFGIALLFAVVLGLWITHVAEQSEERAYLLEELRATQDALAASHHAAGVVAERERLAGEIHDTLAQGFTSVVMLAQTAAAELAGGHVERVAERLGHIEDVARDNLAEARALVGAFSPPGLGDGSLADALRRLAHRFGVETGVRVVVVDDAPDGVPGREAQVVLLRAAQESLANVRRHAGASHVTLRLARAGDDVVLEVVDDGRGLTAGAAEGVGLRGMRARADAAGGGVDVAGSPGDGTRVRVRVPAGAPQDGTTDDDPHPEEEP
ncbi:MAG: sensor histidine kinase [Cellulomonas iranensis]|uniref:sensor histidine kinase n=1 Tax=Cellulomonas iranensis TaxID=76862 RepID=UPI001B1434B4|nr:sensor histidine kinase [Cellulomonas iranensis]MBO9569420.1 sensor histidine kinase [Cellulomonas iranensis]